MTKSKAINDPNPTDADYDAVVAELHTQEEGSPISNPAIDRRQAYRINRMRIIDISLDEGEKLHGLGCIRQGFSPLDFVFTGKNDAKTRHYIRVVFEEGQTENIWEAMVCTCPTDRHSGNPCWHKGAVRAFLADNQHIRYANQLLALPLI